MLELPDEISRLIQGIDTAICLAGIILMICGAGIFAGLSGMVASLFLGHPDQKPSETREILARLEQMQARLDELSKES